MKYTITFIVLLNLLIASFSSNSIAESSDIDAKSHKKEKREVLLDNAFVEVVRLSYPVGTESGMHTHIHPNRVVYVIEGGMLELVPKDKTQKSNVISISAGQALFLPATTHNVRNIGDTDIVIVETEIKNR